MAVLASLVLLLGVVARAQDKDADSKGKSDSSSKTVRLTIMVTGGEDKQPVDNASVYVRYVEERKIVKDKKIEMNLKTNTSGNLPRAGNSKGEIHDSGHRRRLEDVRRIF